MNGILFAINEILFKIYGILFTINRILFTVNVNAQIRVYNNNFEGVNQGDLAARCSIVSIACCYVYL